MKEKKKLYAAIIMLALFTALTVGLNFIDVRAIGPMDSKVGFAGINGSVRDIVGTSALWYSITSWLGIAAVLTAAAFALLGIWQLICRKSIKRLDRDIKLLAIFYVLLAGIYLLFEIVIVNYRPVILDEGLEASYPSSHVLLICCVMGTAALQLKKRIKNRTVKTALIAICVLIIAASVLGRMLSGVHWFTDIFASMLLSSAYVLFYSWIEGRLPKQK